MIILTLRQCETAQNGWKRAYDVHGAVEAPFVLAMHKRGRLCDCDALVWVQTGSSLNRVFHAYLFSARALHVVVLLHLPNAGRVDNRFLPKVLAFLLVVNARRAGRPTVREAQS